MSNKLWAERVTPAYAKAAQTSDQTIPSEDPTEIDFDTVEDEKEGYLEADTSQNRIEVYEDGIYYISAMVTYSDDSNWSTGDVAAANIVSGDDTIEPGEELKIGTGRERAKTTHTGRLDDGDSITVEAYQDSGSDQSTHSDGTAPRVYLAVARLGDQP